MIKKKIVSTNKTVGGLHCANMDLYPYQQKIVDESIFNLKKKNKQLIVVPTGGGKTFIFCHILKKIGLKSLVIAHTKEILDQAKKTLHRLKVKDCEVMSVQKASRNLKNLDDFSILVIDECHRCYAKSYQQVWNVFRDKKILGVTATPFRSDGKPLTLLFDDVIHHMNILDMIKLGLLCDFEGYRVKTGVCLEGISTQNGDFIASKLSSVINVKNRNNLIVTQYKNQFPDHKAICFCASVSHAKELAREFTSHGVACEAVYGDMDQSARREILKKLKENKIQVVANCNLLTEGFDEPSISCLLMARPTCSKVLYTQMIGRGSRTFPGKANCKVIEFTDNDYDVCSIEDLISSNPTRSRIKDGESVTSYAERLKKELGQEAFSVVIEKMEIIKEKTGAHMATQWQLNFLKEKGIYHRDEITEIRANQIITRYINGVDS